MRRFSRKKEAIKASFAFCFLALVAWVGLSNSKPTNADYQKQDIFCCAVNCMDGRVQGVVTEYMQKHYRTDYVDMITEAGPNKILADNPKTGLAKEIVIDIKERIEISQKYHSAKVVAVVGHFGCAGNPVDKDEQIKHLRKAKETVESFGLNMQVVLLWVEKDFKTVKLIE